MSQSGFRSGILLLVASSAFASQVRGDVVTIDVGGFRTAAFGVNSHGWVVGDYATNRNESQVNGYLWIDGAITPIDCPNAVSTRPMGLNDAGDIVGSCGNGMNTRGFLYRGGDYTEFEVPGSVFTLPGGIDDSGDIVGTYCARTQWHNRCDAGSGAVHGFLLRDGRFTTVDVPGAVYTEVWATNGRQLAGRYADLGGVFHAFRLTLETGELVSIDVPGAAATASDWWGFGGGIDDAGEVVGSFCSFEPCTIGNDTHAWTFEADTFHAFLWSAGAVTTIDVPGTILTAGFSISPAGNFIAGTTFTSRIHGGELGFVMPRPGVENP